MILLTSGCKKIIKTYNIDKMTKRQVRLECAECKNINYLTFKNAKNVTEKLTLNKFCNHCRKVTKHTETKKK